jgi:hypothetical protein
MSQVLLFIRKHGNLRVHECCFVWLYIKKKMVWKKHPFCLNTFSLKTVLGKKRKKCMWFDRILLGYWLLYAIKHFFVVCCLVNQIKTSKKMNDKTTWWNKISNVVKCDLHILIVSCIFDFVLHSPTLCKSICCNFFCFRS